MALLLAPACLNLNAATVQPRTSPAVMMAKSTMQKRAAAKLKIKKPKAAFVQEAAPAGVASWYDSGLRLDGSNVVTNMVGVVVPTSVPLPTSAAAKPAPAPAPEPEPVAARPVAWFPKEAPSMAPPIFEKFPEASVFGVKPGGDAPAYLDGSMLGDQGLDPLCLIALADPKLTPDGILKLDQLARSPAARKEKVAAMSAEEQQGALMWMREAEIKHARLAMLAAAGWPLAELVTHHRAPSLFNGHLIEWKHYGNALTLVAFLGAAAFLEVQAQGKVVQGDYGFDPLNLYSGKVGPVTKTPEELRLAELKNGRLAMIAFAGMIHQTFVTGKPLFASLGDIFAAP